MITKELAAGENAGFYRVHVLIQNTGAFLCDWKESTLKPLICVFIQPGHTISTIELGVQLTSAAEIGQKRTCGCRCLVKTGSEG